MLHEAVLLEIPADAWEIPLRELGFLPRTLRALREAGLRTAGDLDGLTPLRLVELDMIGPQAVADVFETLSRWTGRDEAAEGAARGERHGVPAPGFLASVGLKQLGCRHAHRAALKAAGIRSAADVWPLSPEGVARLGRVTLRTAQHLLNQVYVLGELSPDRVRALSRWTPGSVPDLPVATLAALARADTLDGELDALLAHASERNRDVVLRRWGARGLPRPTYAVLARAMGVSQARARQIVEDEERRLQWSCVRLPIAASVVEAVRERDGALAGAELAERLAAAGTLEDPVRLHALPRLSEIGLIPEIAYAAFADTWYIPSVPEGDEDDGVTHIPWTGGLMGPAGW